MIFHFDRSTSRTKLIKLAFLVIRPFIKPLLRGFLFVAHFKRHGSTAHFMYACAVRHLTLCHLISFLLYVHLTDTFCAEYLTAFQFVFFLPSLLPILGLLNY